MKFYKFCFAMLLAFCMTVVSINASPISAMLLEVGEEEVDEELQPRITNTACWSSIDSALNYYIGKDKWECNDGTYSAEGFEITVEGNMCTVQGDDVNYSFYFDN